MEEHIGKIMQRKKREWEVKNLIHFHDMNARFERDERVCNSERIVTSHETHLLNYPYGG